jgi:hypothetical protein
MAEQGQDWFAVTPIDAFVKVLDRLPKKQHGKWIPMTYWMEKVNHWLTEERLSQRKIFTLLQKNHILDRELTADEYGNAVEKIVSTERRVTVDGKSKKIFFLCVESNKKKQPNQFTQEEYQAAYDVFDQRRSIAMVREWQQQQQQQRSCSLVVDTRMEENTDPRTVTPTEQEFCRRDQPPPCPQDTPATDIIIDNDIKELLQPFIDVQYLKPDASNRAFRQAIKEFGCRIQKMENQARLAIFKRDGDDISSLTDIDTPTLTVLDRYCIPPMKSAIQSIIHVALKLDAAGVNGIFQLKQFGGKGTGKRLIPVVPTSPKYFNINAKVWMPQLLDAVVADDSISRLKRCQLICTALQKLVETTMEKETAINKMDPHRQIGMADAANVTYKQLRIMRQYLNANGCNVFHSEHAIRKLEIHSTIEPVFVEFKEDKSKRNGWMLPVETVVADMLGTQDRPNDCLELNVILSADHGQHAWRASISIVLIDRNQKRVIQETCTAVASMDCRKDKRQVLEASGLPKGLNEGLHAVKQQSTEALPIKLKMTGDLAWYSEALGKSNMAGSHCCRCQWRCLKGTKANPRAQHQEWLTINQLKEHFNMLESGELDRSDKSQECGVVATPLIDAIHPRDYLVGPLHCVTLFVNTPFNYLH